MSKRKSTSTLSLLENIKATQQILRKQLCGQSLPHNMYGFEKERSHLFELVKRTATLGESNSVLLVGPRGSGKTMLLKSVLQELKSQTELSEILLEVHLNGLLQTDDRIALKEITRQLQLENTVGDKVFGSFAENLQFLLDALKRGGQETKSIVFILDEFDLFAHHKNQTLLYNLFDVSQSRQAPICVIGLTCRLDVIELLEKRVKSRFSHRQIHLLSDIKFEGYLGQFVSCLSLPDTFQDKTYRKQWNTSIQALAKEDSVRDILRKLYQKSKDLRTLHSLLVLPLCRICENHPQLEAVDLVDSSRYLTQDSKAAMLHGISVLELCLVISMKHLTELYEGEPFNFEMVYNEYRKYAQRRSSMQIFEKPVIMKAFEHLIALELVRPMDGSSSRTQKEYRLLCSLIDSTQVEDSLQTYPGCPTDIRQWAASGVVG
ncbi:unnamed protein product [Owenia fusiformis]|uniref:Origin recognition complex subunit 4 n=1 Tax=Owenia fusiformis TaxID=6347 RepID=A0A8S4N0W8_OWEFU|nr:unnamed protein product [Owenia fusiformis]